MSTLEVLRRGSVRAAKRAHRRFAWQMTRNGVVHDETRERASKSGTVDEFRCLGCARWTHYDDGGTEDGAAAFCCSLCALRLLEDS